MHVLMFRAVIYPVKIPLRGARGAHNTVGTKKIKQAPQGREYNLAVLIHLAHKGEICELGHI